MRISHLRKAEVRLFVRRYFLLLGSFGIVFLLLIAYLVKLQVFSYDLYRTSSDDNHIFVDWSEPSRGNIYDRHGTPLVTSRTAYSLWVDRSALKRASASLIDRMVGVLRLSEKRESAFRQAFLDKDPARERLLIAVMSAEEKARFLVRSVYFPGFFIRPKVVRSYPYDSLAFHALGYVGKPKKEDLETLDENIYRPDSYVGKSGIEKRYEKTLHGIPGYEHIEVDAHGSRVRTLKTKGSIAGKSVYLSLDKDLQLLAEKLMGKRRGAVALMDVRTGELLVYVSTPAIDLNRFAGGMQPEDYQRILGDEDRPFFDRAINGQYPPGSTIKPFMVLAGLGNKTVDTESKVLCKGFYKLHPKGRSYRDWKRKGHGSVDAYRAIKESCDVYFYDLAHRLTIDTMHDFLHDFGFGQKTGFLLGDEAKGILPSPAYKKQALGEAWYPGETLITGIGQGFTLVTPLQLLVATAMLANGGVKLTPTLARVTEGETPPKATQIAIDPEHLSLVQKAMEAVVHEPGGTAYGQHFRLRKTVRMAGKTGTSQVFSLKASEEYDEKKLEERLRDHSLFIGYAPADAPKVAAVAILENSGNGSRAAAPLVAKLIKAYATSYLKEGDS